MYRSGYGFFTLFLSSLFACSQQQRVDSGFVQCGRRPGEVYGATADSMLGGVPVASAGGIIDTERMIERDPTMRTYNHMYALRYELRRFRSQNGRLPDTIEEFSSNDAPGIKINIDGWGSSIRYTRTSDEGYELRAPGPDHQLCTADDMVARNDSLPVITSWGGTRQTLLSALWPQHARRTEDLPG